MSRAFAKEDTAGGELRYKSRPELPEGQPNYVTERGLALLHQEREGFLEQLDGLGDSDEDNTERAGIELSLQHLELRIASAEVVKLSPVTADTTAEIGHHLTIEFAPNDTETIVISGVDEAELDDMYVSFAAPLAQAMLGKKAGEVGSYQVGERTVEVTLREITAPSPDDV